MLMPASICEHTTIDPGHYTLDPGRRTSIHRRIAANHPNPNPSATCNRSACVRTGSAPL
ncbi:hypothetical protein B0H17DRAFT_1076924, partial [Mycena rosella]